MTNDEGLKPEGAPERSPKAGVGAPSGVDENGPKRFSVQRKMAIVARASVYRSLKETQPNRGARRLGPVGACPDAELEDNIRQQIAASRLHGEGYRKLWARLRFAGVRASPRRVRRVMRDNGLLAPHRVGRTEAKPHDGTIITDKVNEMWGTDMTQTITVEEGRA